MKPITEEERFLAAEAKRKRAAGERPSQIESRALKRLERVSEDDTKRHHYHNCPKKLYCELSGRPHKVLNEQATRYNLPIGGDVIDLFQTITRFHDMLADIARKGIRFSDDDDVLGDAAVPSSPALERWRLARAKQEEIKLEAVVGDFLARAAVQQFLTTYSSRVRAVGDRLQREGHSEAYRIFEDALDDLDRMVDVWAKDGRTRESSANGNGSH